MSLVTNRIERMDVGSACWADSQRLVVASARSDRGRWIVRWEGVATREAAEALKGSELTAEPLDDDVLWVDRLIGLRLSDAGSDRGEIIAVQENPASDLLALDSGALVPARFVTGIVEGVVHTACPAGLFDLP